MISSIRVVLSLRVLHVKAYRSVVFVLTLKASFMNLVVGSSRRVDEGSCEHFNSVSEGEKGDITVFSLFWFLVL